MLYSKGGTFMERITRIIPPEEDGSTVRHILRATLHFSSHAISRLTRMENGILVNGQPVRTTYILRAGEELRVKTGDNRPPKTAITPGNWPLPVVWEDGHLLIVNKPAGMTAHASNFYPDTPTVAGALAWTRGTDFIFHPVNRLDKGTTGLMAVAKSGYVHDLLRRALHTDRFQREYLAVCTGVPGPSTHPLAATKPPWSPAWSGLTARLRSLITRSWPLEEPARWSASGPKPDARTSFASTWPISAVRFWGTGCTAQKRRRKSPVPRSMPAP